MGIQINGNNDTISALDGSWTAQGATTFTGAADFNGKVSVGGTLTYEDVTNIDSVGIVTARDGVFIPDTKKLEVGNAAGSGDLKIHHTSGNSFIENGTGTLKIRGATIELSNPSAAQMLQANSTAAINLYFNGSKKFETTSSGIDVTGVVVADDLIVTGTSVVGDFKSTNNNYVLGIAGNNSSVKAYFGTDSSGNFLLATGSGVAERLRITTAGNVDINGSPPWSVAGGDYRNLSISGQIANAGGFLWLGNGTATTNGDFDLGRINFCNGATITSQIAGSTQTSANDDGRITFLTKATGGSIAERLRITSTGVVSINDSTPETFATLQVKNHTGSNAAQFLLHGADMAQIILRDDTGGSNTKCTTIRNDQGAFLVGTHNDSYGGFSEKLRITSTGQLQATGAADVRLTLGSSGTAGTNNSVHVRADSADLKFMAASGGTTIFETNGTETLRIDSSGRIGIDYTPGSGDGPFNLDISGSNNIFHLGHGANNDNYYTTGASGTQYFRTPSANQLVIKSNGKVGIGTDTPTAQLSFNAQRSTQTYPPICFQSSYGAGLADAAISTTDDTGGTDIMMGSNVYMGQNGAFVRYFSSYGSAAVRCQYTGKTIFYNKGGNNAPVESMRINSDGRLLLGDTNTAWNATSDGYKMSIKETSAENAAIVFLDTDAMKGGICGIAKGTDQILVGTTNVDFIVGSSYADTHLISGNGSNSTGYIRATINTRGNVGINQTNPNKAKLHVVADSGTTDEIVAKFRNPQGSADVKAKIGFACGYSDTANDTEGQAYIGGQRESNGNNAALIFETSDGSTVSERLRIESGGTIRTINGVQSGGNGTGGLKFTSNYSGKGFDIATQYATQGNGGSNGGDPMFSGWWGSSNTFRVNSSGQIKFGASLNGQVQSGSFSVPAGGTKTVTVSGLVSGAYMFQGGTYSSSGQGMGGIHFTDSGYQTASYTHDIHEIDIWSNGGGNGIAISGVSKNASSSSFTVSNSHGSFNAGFNWHIWGNDEVVVTIS